MLIPPFDAKILAADPERRALLLKIMQAALAAVEPGAAVRRAMQRVGSCLHIGGLAFNLDATSGAYRRVFLIGFGKAALPMGQAAADILGGYLAGGVLVTKKGHAANWANLPSRLVVYEGGHPVPDEAGVVAATHIASMARAAGPDDLILCLISGGGSALLTLPAAGLSLGDLQAVTNALLRSGAAIAEINAVRKHLDQLKGGQLARLAAPATLVTLVLSDVVGSPLDAIASGPTVPDPSTWASAWAVLERYGLISALPASVQRHLAAGLCGALPDTPKAGDPIFAVANAHDQEVMGSDHPYTWVVADNALAASAAQQAARDLDLPALVLSTAVEGEAREVARLAVGLGREVAAHGRITRAPFGPQRIAPPVCLILGGETTVTVRGQGKGGRNQELALAAALQLDALPEGQRIVVASLATDGSDGPTDAAGALVDGSTVSRGQALGLDAAAYLARNDAYPFLAATGDLLLTGPTHTNVNDLILIGVW